MVLNSIPVGTKVSLIKHETLARLEFESLITFSENKKNRKVVHYSINSDNRNIKIFDLIELNIKWEIIRVEKYFSSDTINYTLSGNKNNKNYTISCNDDLFLIKEEVKAQLIEENNRLIKEANKKYNQKFAEKYVCLGFKLVTGGTTEQISINCKDLEIKFDGKNYYCNVDNLILNENDLETLYNKGCLDARSLKITEHTTFQYSNIFMYTKDEMSRKPKDSKVEWYDR